MIRSFVGLQARTLTRPCSWLNPRCPSSSPSEELSRPNEEPVVIEAAKRTLTRVLGNEFPSEAREGQMVPRCHGTAEVLTERQAPDVAKVLQRAAKIANIYHGLIPEELRVKEIWVNKGFMQKKMRIMGRGGRASAITGRLTCVLCLSKSILMRLFRSADQKTFEDKMGGEKKELVQRKKSQLTGQSEDAEQAEGHTQNVN